MAAPLLSVAELSVWTRETIDLADPFAVATIEAASLVVRDLAGHPEWTHGGAVETEVPERARLIAIQIAKRAYLNPDAERSFSVGQLGGATVEDYARTLEPTPAERAVLEAIRAEVIPDASAGVLFTMTTHNRRPGTSGTVVLNDSSGSGIVYAGEGEFDTVFGDPVV